MVEQDVAQPANSCACGHVCIRMVPHIGVRMVEQDVTEPPPLVVLVQGPPGVGKTTLIRNLVKHYVNQSLGEVKGPITLVAGKTRRLTFVECPQVCPEELLCSIGLACKQATSASTEQPARVPAHRWQPSTVGVCTRAGTSPRCSVPRCVPLLPASG